MFKQLPPIVLVTTPNNNLSTSICNTIERYWFNTIKSNDFEQTIKLVKKHHPHVLVISDMFGNDIISKIISNINTLSNNIVSFVILSSDDTIEDFNSEFIEIVKKPFTPYEIITSIRSLLRKSKPIFQNTILVYKDLTMNLAIYRVLRGSRLIRLGPTEFTILQLLMTSPCSVFSRSMIVEYIWGKDYQIDTRTVDVHINRIRALLKNTNDKEPIIKTIRSLGYCLELKTSQSEK